MFDSQIGSKLYDKTPDECIKDIIKKYNQNLYVVVNFLYFANIVSQNLFKNNQTKYYKALMQGDFLLPDGIALQIYFKRWFKKNFYNLNGTDFLPHFINFIKDKYNLNIFFYGTTKDALPKAVENFEKKFGLKVKYFQNGFSEFDFFALNDFISFERKNDINLLLVGRGTPLQETWVAKNIENIQKYKLICFCVGGLFDFWAGVDKRAPLFIRKLKLEWLRRLITNPKKNYKKVLNSLSILKMLIIR